MAIAFVVFAMPVYLLRFQLWFLPMTILEIMILILFVVWLIKARKIKEKISLSNYKWWGLVFLLTATISVVVATDRVSALGVWRAYFIEPIMFFVVFINSIKTKEDWQRIIKALVWSALFVSVPAVIQKFTGWGITNEFWKNEETRRVVSWYGFPNAVGLYLAPIAMIMAGLILQSKIKFIEAWKAKEKVQLSFFEWLTFITFILSSLAIIFAKSEGALIGLLGGLVFLGLFYPYKLSRYGTLGLVVVLLVVGFVVPQVRNYAAEKFTLSDRSGQIRQQQWSETMDMLEANNEIFGAGLSNYQEAVYPYHKEAIWIEDKNEPNWKEKIQTDEEYRIKMWQPLEIYMYPHNFFLNFWSELGLFGLLAMIVLTLKFVANYFRVKSDENKKIYLILLAALIVVLVHGQVDVPYLKNDLSVLWWLLFGMSWLLIKNKKMLYE